MNITWDAQEYTNNFSFVHQYGSSLIDLISFRPNMTCLDLGCGNGALTAKLRETGLSVIGMDASEELLAIAKTQHSQIEFIQGDATDFVLKNPVDVVFSNAVFHWIDTEKQSAMLHNVFQALKPGGQFVFEFGGKGNNALIHGALEKAFKKRKLLYEFPFYFPSIAEYTTRMEQAGFRVTYATLFDRPTLLTGSDGLYDWIKMFIKTPFSNISEQWKEEIIREAVNDLKPELYIHQQWYADYVRLRCKAVR